MHEYFRVDNMIGWETLPKNHSAAPILKVSLTVF
jgi:hypothetical protein